MTKPDVTLQPSKGIITQSAAQIFAAYITAGRVKDDDADTWMKRSIREAVTIAKTVDASVQSDQELPDQGGQMLKESSVDSELPSEPAEGELFRTDVGEQPPDDNI